MTSKRKIKFDSNKGKADAFFYKMVHYGGIIFLLLVMIYACYILLPDIFKFIKDFIISLIKKDYPNAG
jgi:hypothetical protein